MRELSKEMEKGATRAASSPAVLAVEPRAQLEQAA
jgi:hypothetical protein